MLCSFRGFALLRFLLSVDYSIFTRKKALTHTCKAGIIPFQVKSFRDGNSLKFTKRASRKDKREHNLPPFFRHLMPGKLLSFSLQSCSQLVPKSTSKKRVDNAALWSSVVCSLTPQTSFLLPLSNYSCGFIYMQCLNYRETLANSV